MNEHYEDLLALAILFNKTHANAYSLCSILSRKFNIIDCSEIINRIESQGYVSITYPKEQKLESFTLTTTGEQVLYEERLLLGKVLKENFPGEIEYITLLEGNIGNVSKGNLSK